MLIEASIDFADGAGWKRCEEETGILKECLKEKHDPIDKCARFCSSNPGRRRDVVEVFDHDYGVYLPYGTQMQCELVNHSQIHADAKSSSHIAFYPIHLSKISPPPSPAIL